MLIDHLIIIQDSFDLTNENEMHMLHDKNLHASDENLVTEFVFTSYIDTVILSESISLHHRHQGPYSLNLLYF